MSNVDISKCRITHYPASILAERAEEVERIDDNTRQLVEKMVDIMFERKGIGLAGPQAGVPLQIFITSLEQTKENVKVYINPSVTCSGPLETAEEGCLSVPEVDAKIQRYKKCEITAVNLNGETFTEEADGLYARVLQHENDHLNGMAIVDRMGSVARIKYRKQLKKLAEEYENSSKEQK